MAPPLSVDEGEPALAHHYEKCYNDTILDGRPMARLADRLQSKIRKYRILKLVPEVGIEPTRAKLTRV